MPFFPHNEPTQVHDEVSGVALRALSILALDSQQGGYQRRPSLPVAHYLDPLFFAVIHADRAPLSDIVDEMISLGVTAEEIADIYVPTLARMLGDAWLEDVIDFAKTTIAASRLQGLLRWLGPDWCAETLRLPLLQRSVLVALPKGAQHTLGATILAGQLRRKGISVNLELGLSADDVRRAADRFAFDAVLISAAGGDSLDLLSCMVQSIKTDGRKTPVVVGGNILEHMTNLKDYTGADLATSCLQDAIRFCELDKKSRVRDHLRAVE